MPEAPLPATLSLPIAGMTCATCAQRVERAFGRVPGVLSARVNLATGRAAIEGTAPLPALIEAVTKAGYTVPEARFDLVRVGIAAYGIDPAPGIAELAGVSLRPVMRPWCPYPKRGPACSEPRRCHS